MRHFSTTGDHVDLVMLDVTLPEMNGPECLARIRKIPLDIPSVLVSGFSELDLKSPLTLDERTRFLTKPCLRSDLINFSSRYSKTPKRRQLNGLCQTPAGCSCHADP